MYSNCLKNTCDLCIINTADRVVPGQYIQLFDQKVGAN